MRTLQNINKNTEGVVQEFIGTAYDDVKLVADNLDTIQLVVDAIDNLNPAAFATAAQGITADSALQPEDIDTLGKLNAIVAEDIVGTNDSRLTNARVPTAHTHVAADISDLTLGNYLLETEIDTLAKINAIVTDADLVAAVDARLTDARTPLAHVHAFNTLTGVPATLAGHSITDAYTKAYIDALTFTFASLTSKPTTLAGYGITDAAPISHVGGNIHIDWSVTGAENIHPDRYTDTDTVYSHPATHPFSMLTGKPTTLVGYGIADGNAGLTNTAGYLTVASLNTLAELNALIDDANLGDISMFATAAQGALADTALQAGAVDHNTLLNYVADQHLPSSTFATAAQGALADTAIQPADINTLGELNTLVGVTLVVTTDPRLDDVEGVDVKSTGATAGHTLKAVGDNTAIWSAPGTIEGTAIQSTGIPNGRVLTANGANASTWVAPTTYSSLLAVKGDIETFDTGRVKLGVGTNGHVLTADSTLPKGIKWAALPAASVAGMTSIYTSINRVMVDKEDIYSDSGLTHTLPASPTTGLIVTVRDFAKDASNNNITINRNSSLINGVASNFVMNVDGQIVSFMCNSAGNWITSTVSDAAFDYAARVKIILTTTYTILEADNAYRLLFNNAASIAVTVPDGLSLGHNFIATQIGVGRPTLTPNTDVVNGALTGVFPDARWGSVNFVQFDYAEWLAEYTKAGSYLSLP